MTTHPDTLAAIKAAQDHVSIGNNPRKFLICSPQTIEEIRQHSAAKQTERDEIKQEPTQAINIWQHPEFVEVNVRREWTGRRWELCDAERRDQIFSVNIWMDRKHDHFFVVGEFLYESYKTIRGLRYRGRGYCPGIPNIEKCTDDDLIKIQKVLVQK